MEVEVEFEFEFELEMIVIVGDEVEYEDGRQHGAPARVAFTLLFICLINLSGSLLKHYPFFVKRRFCHPFFNFLLISMNVVLYSFYNPFND